MKLLEASTQNLSYLLSKTYGTLVIPFSQRPYEWGQDQVRRIFNDFCTIFNETGSKHVLNFITIKVNEEEDNNKYLYDGQQRTVTSLMILSALIDELRKYDDIAAMKLTDDFLYSSDWKDSSNIEHKILFNNDASNFMLNEHILKNKSLPNNHVLCDYDKALYNNYSFIKTLIYEKFSKSPTLSDIKELIHTILYNVLVIIIETSYEDIAEEMFETLNSTGLQLEDFYILKNTLVQTLSEPKVKPLWSAIESNTDRIDKGRFLHSYLNTLRGKTPSNKLYNRIEETRDLKDKKDALSFLEELKMASEIYMKIEKPSQRTDGNKQEISKYLGYIKHLSSLKANQFKPVVLAMGLRGFKISEVNAVLEKIISLQLRNIFICEYQANTLEQFYPALANEIYLKKIKSVNSIVTRIKNEIAGDNVLLEKFNTKLIKTNVEKSVIRNLLKEMYNSQQSEIVINADSKEVNLEHILPSNPSPTSQWFIDFPDEENRNILTQKIGNFTVLLHQINSKIKNSDFATKKNNYKISTIPQNIALSEKKQWKESDINQRTIELYNLFNSKWPK